MIVDTSVWINNFRGIQNPETRKVAEAILADQPVCITPTILQEVLQGIQEDHLFSRVKIDLLACTMLRIDPVEAAIGAAELYRSLRRKGVTIRKPSDCLIAYYAIFYNIPVLHNDIDFAQIAHHAPLRIALE